MKKIAGSIAVILTALTIWGQSLINTEWVDAPFGDYLAAWAGGSSYSAGTYTVIGNGNNMAFASNDGGRFVFKPVVGDCDLTAIVQKPIDDSYNYFARSGIMLRETNDRANQYMTLLRMRGDATDAGRIQSNARLAYQSTPATISSNGYTNDWLKMRLIRRGSTFSAYTSTGAVDNVWELYRQESIPMGETLHAGIFVSVHVNSTASLMTNDFQQLSANSIVALQTNATDGIDITWLTDLPFLPTNSCQYSYSVTRTELDGTAATVAADLLTPFCSDNTITKGAYYKYSVAATELPYTPQAVTGTVHVGTSGTFRHPAAETNLVTGIAAGVTVAYYDLKSSVTPYALSNATSLAALLTPAGGETTDYKSVADACINVDATDLYTFFLELDDSSEIFIDGVRIQRHWDYGGDRLTASAPVRLEQGRAHAFRILFHQATGGQKFVLRWNRVGAPAITAVPDSVFTPVSAGWTSADIGNGQLNGNALFDEENDTITVTASGNTLTNTVDSGRVVLTGTGTSLDLTTCLTELTSSAAQPRAGLTVRGDIASSSAAISLLAIGGGSEWSLQAVVRSAAGAAPAVTEYTTSISAADPIALRITQSGVSYLLSYKAEGAALWTPLDSFTAPLLNAQCGLITSSGDLADAATAVFTATGLNPENAVKLLPTDDTYVQSDNSLRGAETLMAVKHRGTTTMREALLRFNVSGISSLSSATLRLRISSRNVAVPTQDVNLRVFHNMEWQEETLRWNTPPAGILFPNVFMSSADPTLVTRFPTSYAGETIDLDVTDQVMQALSGTGDLTFVMSATISIDATLDFFTKEAGDTTVRPYLIITTAAPYGLKASGSVVNTEIKLAWSSYPGAQSYNLYRAASADGTYALAAGAITATSYTDTGLTPGTPYFYKVTAVTAAEESEMSEAADARTTTGAFSQTASEDAFIQGGTSANNNYNGTTLTCKSNYTDYNFHREPYFKFDDISGLAHAAQVILRVTPQNSTGGTILPSQIPVNFIRMPDNSWSESTVTWNNYPIGYPPPRPKNDSAPASDRVTAIATAIGVPMDVDITEIVRKAALVNSDSKLSIGALRLDNLGSFNLVFHSSEATSASFRPQLLYSAVNRPILPEPDTSGFCPVLDWSSYPNANAYGIYRAESKTGPYTLLTNTTATAFSDLTTLSGKVYFYTLTAVTNSVETEPSLPVAAGITVGELRYPVADTAVDGNDQYKNFGADTTVNLKWSPTREQLFKFDVRGLENITSARFKINPVPTDAAYTAVNIRLWQGDYGDWNEYGVRFNANYLPVNYVPQQSNMANHLATIKIEYRDIGSRLLFAEADVTDAIRTAAQAGKRYLTLVYTGDPATPDGKGMMYTAMREYAGVDKDPVLILSGSTFTAPEGVIAEETVTAATESGVTLTWRPVAGADHYVITRISPSGESTVVAESLTGSTFTDVSTTFRNTGEYTYTVTAVNADGTTASSSASVTLVRRMTAPVLADTFVRSGNAYSNSVYGTSHILELKRDSNGLSDLNREAFFRIDATNSPAFVNAYLRVVLRSVNTTTDVDAFLVEIADSGWTEGNANWITMRGSDYSSTPVPASNDPLLLDMRNIQSFTVGSEMFFDITANLRAAKARGDSTFVMHLFNGTVGGNTNYSLWSKDSASNENIPSVIYVVSKYPPEGTLLMLR